MRSVSREQVTAYVKANIGTFHSKRLESLAELRLPRLLQRKNPYLFKSKNIDTVSELVRSLLDAHLASQEETLFGNFLEGLAVHVAETVHGGIKSSARGIDLEFVKNGNRYLISIKSGPNWGNSSQVNKMREDFRRSIAIIRQGASAINVVAVNGCCYGRDAKPDKGDYIKLCGQEFWTLISNDTDFYVRIVQPIGHDAKRRNDEFGAKYSAVINQFSLQFTEQFCHSDGSIDWHRLVAFSSAKDRPRD